MSELHVSCIGNITQDKLLRVDSIPELDDVAYVNESVECMGGRGAIVALALGRLGISTSLVTAVSNDSIARNYLEFLQENNVDVSSVAIDNSAESLFKVIVAISKEQENCISFFEPSNINFSSTPGQLDTVNNSDIVYFSTHKRSFNESMLSSIKNDSTKVIHNISSYFLQSKEYVSLMLNRSNILIGNELETSALLKGADCSSPQDLFNYYSNLETIYATQGDAGSWIYSKDSRPCFVEAQGSESVSPVGAGDAYAAGVIYGIANGWSNIHCAEFASKVASISVGSATSYPDLDTLDRLIGDTGGEL